MTLDGERVPWLYFDDFGEAHRTHALYGTVKQTDDAGHPLVGGRTPGPSERAYRWTVGPRGIKPRTVTVVNPQNARRLQVVIYNLDAPLWVGTATELQMFDYDPDEGRVRRTYKVCGRKSEDNRRIWGGSGRTPAPQPVLTTENSDSFDSSIEQAFWETWQKRSKIRLVRQHPVRGYRLDFAHLPTKTAIELDGYFYHSDQERFRKDRQRDRELTQEGWRVIRFVGDEIVDNVDRCVEEALRLIRASSPGTEEPA